MRADVQRLRDYQDAKLAWEKERIELEQLSAEADRRFRELIQTLHPNASCGITLENNLRPDNRLRYDLKVLVDQDSDGARAASIMAFDWLIYRHGANHTMRHLWHDNGLFDRIADRQIAAWLKWTMQALRESDTQYIVSINTESFASTRDMLARQEAKALAALIHDVAAEGWRV